MCGPQAVPLFSQPIATDDDDHSRPMGEQLKLWQEQQCRASSSLAACSGQGDVSESHRQAWEGLCVHGCIRALQAVRSM